MTYIPVPNTDRDAICRVLHKAEHAMRLAEIHALLPRITNNATGAALTRLRAQGAVEHTSDGWKLSQAVKQHYDECAGPEGEIVASRYVPPFKPMKSVPWAEHLDKIRTDVGFKSSGLAFPSGVVL